MRKFIINSMAKPIILAIHGGMCSGKTETTRELRFKLKDFVFVDREHIKLKELGPLKKTKGKEFVRQLSNEFVAYHVKRLMENKINILLQETRYNSIYKKFGDEIEKYGYEVKTFYLDCDVEEAVRREPGRLEAAMQRDPQIGKKSPNPELVREMHEKHAYPDPEDVVLPQSYSVDKKVEAILCHLP